MAATTPGVVFDDLGIWLLLEVMTRGILILCTHYKTMTQINVTCVYECLFDCLISCTGWLTPFRFVYTCFFCIRNWRRWQPGLNLEACCNHLPDYLGLGETGCYTPETLSLLAVVIYCIDSALKVQHRNHPMFQMHLQVLDSLRKLQKLHHMIVTCIFSVSFCSIFSTKVIAFRCASEPCTESSATLPAPGGCDVARSWR